MEGFGDLHLSASEPRIFPGLVSRKQRKDSVAGKSSQEIDDFTGVRRSTSDINSANSQVEVDNNEEEASDYEMEEAGGSDN